MPPFDAAAGHPDGEAEDVMVAAVGPLRPGRAAELGGEDDDRFFEQPALLQVLQQRRRSAGRPRSPDSRVIGLQPAVGVPRAGAAARHAGSG